MQHIDVDLDLISKYDVSGPRYTSYPTALQFSDISPDQYRKAAAASTRSSDNLSLYVHIPFCDTLCYYCACSKIVTRDHQKAADYLKLLVQEIGLQAPLFQNRVVSQLHWGGGTPTFLNDEEIVRLMGALHQNFIFESDDQGEFGIEIDPRTVDHKRIEGLRSAGFNRLSMGIQDFDPVVQKAVNRKQPFDATLGVMQAARSSGFRSISVDLIYGLPHQSVRSMAKTLDQVVELKPDRISIYNYAHLPDRFPPQRRINVVDLPDADGKLQILKLCIDKLTTAGYQYIGMDHFALPEDNLSIAQGNGTLHRNFQGYSTFADCDMVAMGVTGISQVGHCYAQNAKTLDEYSACIEDGELAIHRGVEIDEDDLIRKSVIMALICQLECRYSDIQRDFGVTFPEYFKPELDALSEMEIDQLVSIDTDRLKVTDRGRLLIRNICMIFDRHLQKVDRNISYSRAI